MTATFNAPYLTAEFADYDLHLELSESLNLNCVAKVMGLTEDGLLIVKVSHIFRLLHPPVQEFLLYQFLFFTEVDTNDMDAWIEADTKAFEKITGKYDHQEDAMIIYASDIFTPVINHHQERFQNLLLLYKASRTVDGE